MNPSADIRTVEMHTAGEPLRIVTAGYPDVPGDSILAKRRYARAHLDDYRKLLMYEPRGHRDMYGAVRVEPDHPAADFAVLFMHNEGYSTMCGHGVIALGRWAVDRGIVAATEPETRVAIQVPAGLVQATVATAAGATGAVRFESVPAFALHLDAAVDVPGRGLVAVDVAYGGAFYAFLPADRLGLDVTASATEDLVAGAWAVTRAVRETLPISHPDDPDLGFLYGTILTDGADQWSEQPTANICVFADRQVDRSPTGSGVTARITIQLARGQIKPGQERKFRGPAGGIFTGRALEPGTVGRHPATTVEVAGHAHYTGENRFTIDPTDPLPAFLLE